MITEGANKIVYVKPQIHDLGEFMVVYGSCIPNGYIANDPDAGQNCPEGYTATGGGTQAVCFPSGSVPGCGTGHSAST